MKFSLLLVFVICLQLKVANTNKKSGQKAQNEKNFTIYFFRNTKRNQTSSQSVFVYKSASSAPVSPWIRNPIY